MKNRSATIKRAIYFLAIIIMFLPSVAYSADVTINYITFVRRNHYYVKTFKQNFKEIERRSNGRIKFRYRGGPESIKIFEQAMAVKKGATDMVLTTPSFTGKMVKGPEILTLSKSPVSEHRKTGLYAYMNDVYNPIGLKFIQVIPEPPGRVFRMMTKYEIKNSKQFTGNSLRGGDWMDAVAPALGMQTLAIRFGEDYAAMERGLITISRSTIVSMNAFKIHEVADYLIKTAWGSAPASWLMNLKKWNSIPQDLQDLILDTLYELAGPTQKLYEAEILVAEKKLLSEGVELVELEDEADFIKIAEERMYKYFTKDSPEVSKRIFELSQ